MKLNNENVTELLNSRLRTSFVGLILAVLTILFGQGMGIVFGLNEEAITNSLKASAVEMRDSVYMGDEVAIKEVLNKSWKYMQRAHLHAGAMGTTALVLIVLISLLNISQIKTLIISLLLGAGGLGFSVFWMWAGFRAPALGSTGAAKESLKWLAMPSSGGFVLATLAVLVVLILKVFRQPKQSS